MRRSCLLLPLPRGGDLDAICDLQDMARDPLTEQGDWRDVVSQLINREDARADHLGLGGEEGGEDQPRAVTQQQTVTEVQSLQDKSTFNLCNSGTCIL